MATEKEINDYCESNGIERTGVFATEEETQAFATAMRTGRPLFFVSDLDMLRAGEDRHTALAGIHELARQKYGLPDMGKFRDLDDGEICDNRYGMLVNGEFNKLKKTPDGWEKVEGTEIP